MEETEEIAQVKSGLMIEGTIATCFDLFWHTSTLWSLPVVSLGTLVEF